MRTALLGLFSPLPAPPRCHRTSDSPSIPARMGFSGWTAIRPGLAESRVILRCLTSNSSLIVVPDGVFGIDNPLPHAISHVFAWQKSRGEVKSGLSTGDGVSTSEMLQTPIDTARASPTGRANLRVRVFVPSIGPRLGRQRVREHDKPRDSARALEEDAMSVCPKALEETHPVPEPHVDTAVFSCRDVTIATRDEPADWLASVQDKLTELLALPDNWKCLPCV